MQASAARQLGRIDLTAYWRNSGQLSAANWRRGEVAEWSNAPDSNGGVSVVELMGTLSHAARESRAWQ